MLADLAVHDVDALLRTGFVVSDVDVERQVWVAGHLARVDALLTDENGRTAHLSVSRVAPEARRSRRVDGRTMRQVYAREALLRQLDGLAYHLDTGQPSGLGTLEEARRGLEVIEQIRSACDSGILRR